MPSIVSQIDFFEERIKHCEDRLEDIASSLNGTKLTSNRRDDLTVEREQLSSALLEHKKNLSSLRHENRRTMLLSVAIFIIIASVYLLLQGT
ncbi:coiled-coil domain-containing protein 167-like [Hydractinia symbiolongicarpus]|uniref:coiled-coil domain-containing protein 167-like n=1 Tax=Hydractinia symbiolongicarpus TaxID=13093 RepID=UPI00254E65D1|nr:coiled-coil domain-containing protein 167-like [Hydractinia symbiolongicarpus]